MSADRTELRVTLEALAAVAAELRALYKKARDLGASPEELEQLIARLPP